MIKFIKSQKTGEYIKIDPNDKDSLKYVTQYVTTFTEYELRTERDVIIRAIGSQLTLSVNNTMGKPSILNNLHHFAWKCANVDETIAFYEGMLGLPYVHKIEKDHVPSTGEYAPYKHIFFQLADKSHIAFFDVGDGKGVTTDCDDWIVHFAFEVNSKEDVDAWHTKLIDNDIDVIGPTNHDDWIYSIYFFDPNGLRLEITTRLT